VCAAFGGGGAFTCSCDFALAISQRFIREENLLQMVLRITVHFALFLVKISINFSPGYSTVFFSITVYVSTLQKFQNFITKISKFLYNVLTNKKIAYSMRVVHSTVGTLVHWLYYIPIKAWSCAISSGVVYWLSGLCSVFQCYSYIHITFVLHTSWIAGSAANTTSIH
jgi:hypothetical protein